MGTPQHDMATPQMYYMLEKKKQQEKEFDEAWAQAFRKSAIAPGMTVHKPHSAITGVVEAWRYLGEHSQDGNGTKIAMGAANVLTLGFAGLARDVAQRNTSEEWAVNFDIKVKWSDGTVTIEKPLALAQAQMKAEKKKKPSECKALPPAYPSYGNPKSEVRCAKGAVFLGSLEDCKPGKWICDGKPSTYLRSMANVRVEEGSWGSINKLQNACKWNRVLCAGCGVLLGRQPVDYKPEVPAARQANKGFHNVKLECLTAADTDSKLLSELNISPGHLANSSVSSAAVA